MKPAAVPATGFVLALVLTAPVAARGLHDNVKVRSPGVPASVIAAGQDSSGALDEGRALLAGNNPAQAISAFRIALAQTPQSVAALNGIAVAYDRLGRTDLARQHFEMALSLEPDAADIAYNLGLAMVRTGRDRAAIPHLQRAAAGNDPRAAAAARRTLVLIAKRLTTPEAPAAMAPAPEPALGPRIDIASSGEAVLVLAPSPAPAMAAAPVRMAAAAPAAPPVRATAAAPATITLALADRLGEVATLTIPQTVSMAMPVAAREDAPMPAPPTIHIGPQPPLQQQGPRAAAASAPALAAQPNRSEPAQPANRTAPAVATAPRPLSPAAVLVSWRRANIEHPVAASNWASSNRERPLPPPQDDDKTAIRLAIARLENLLSLIEVQRG